MEILRITTWIQNLQELNSIIQNKKSAEIIQSGDNETDENDLTKIVSRK